MYFPQPIVAVVVFGPVFAQSVFLGPSGSPYFCDTAFYGPNRQRIYNPCECYCDCYIPLCIEHTDMYMAQSTQSMLTTAVACVCSLANADSVVSEAGTALHLASSFDCYHPGGSFPVTGLRK